MIEGLSRETLAAQALGEVDPTSGAISPAIHPSTIYERSPDGTYKSGLTYTRADNPTYDHAERLLATLEGGAQCMLFASGMAAATAVFQSLLPGDHVLVSRILYWAIRRWLAEFPAAWGLDVEFIDTTDLGQVAAAIRPGRTRLLWVETPANPMWDVTDLAAVTRIAHAADVRVAADNTAASPVLTRPIEFGVDLGGVESLIEHRRSTEGPSSPVPDDLLRLSIGLETPDDLIADLGAALDTVAKAGAARAPMAEPAQTSLPGSDLSAAVLAAVERSVAPTIIARGG